MLKRNNNVDCERVEVGGEVDSDTYSFFHFIQLHKTPLKHIFIYKVSIQFSSFEGHQPFTIIIRIILIALSNSNLYNEYFTIKSMAAQERKIGWKQRKSTQQHDNNIIHVKINFTVLVMKTKNEKLHFPSLSPYYIIFLQSKFP